MTMRAIDVPHARANRRRIWIATITCLLASVWIYHGLVNKLLGASPRHLMIVQSMPGFGGEVGRVVLLAVGAAEVLLGIWIISGRRPWTAAAVQTIALLTMNVMELAWARGHLLWPAGLLPINLAFLVLAWANAALREPKTWADLSDCIYRFQRHPIPVTAHFDHSLVLTYAFPRHLLERLLPPGLELDTHGDWGFVAVAMVQTRGLRPAFIPRICGKDFSLTGYRIFVKFRTPGGRTLRGLHILRSDADRWSMVIGGNLLTHYHYRKCESHLRNSDSELDLAICTKRGEADLHVVADLTGASTLPAESPFRREHDAKRFAGPLPFTFDYEPQTHSIVMIRGVRSNWSPRLVPVDVRQVNFFNRPPFRSARPILASAFYVHDIPYRWERGIRVPLPEVKS